MAGVVVWACKLNRATWHVYEPDVSCELERLHSLGTQQNINLGTISQNLSNYEVSFTQMNQTNLSTGSVNDIKRCTCGPTSGLAKGVVWKFEGDSPSHWMNYDLESMNVIEEAYAKRQQTHCSFLDLQKSLSQLPYLIDFNQMTQKRAETGRIRRIQRLPLSKMYTPLMGQAFGTNSSGLPFSSVFPGQASRQSQQGVHRHRKTKPKNNHPYTKSGTVSAQAGFPNGLNGFPIQAPQQIQQRPLQIPGPVRRSQVQQTAGNSFAAFSTSQHTQNQSSVPMYQSYYPAYQNHHGQNPWSCGYSNNQVIPPGVQFPPSTSLQQHSFLSNMNALAPALPTQQASRPSSASSSMSSSSSSSSMSVVGYQVPESLPIDMKISIGKSKKTNDKAGHEMLSSYMKSISKDLGKSDCSICFNKLSEASSYGDGQPDAHEAVELNKCGHQFHKLCLLEMYNSIHKDNSLQCPSCKTIYGEKSGTCPPGYMQWRVVQNLPLPGYESYGTIIVSYHISPGVQGPEHPNPGKRFSARGFPRYGYLPDSDKGRKVLKLLMEAFKRRLMFTIATSNTTGEENTVTWNEIHHKTEPHGNSSGHGYPDPQYLDNVLLELAAHGVTVDCLN